MGLFNIFRKKSYLYFVAYEYFTEILGSKSAGVGNIYLHRTRPIESAEDIKDIEKVIRINRSGSDDSFIEVAVTNFILLSRD